MEDNIADALKMAGSVLLFVIGLSISFLYFSQARQSIDTVLSYSDRESTSIEYDKRFYYLNNNETSRYVGKETIIPSIYRACKENFKIVFVFNDSSYYLFKKDGVKTDTIDLEKQAIASDAMSRRFLDGIIYGKFDNEDTTNIESKADFEKEFKVKIDYDCLYEYLTNKELTHKIKEELGTYYIEDVGGTKERVKDVNKTEKRVITYSFIAD